RPDSANVLRNGRVLTVSPDEVKIGERILVKPGEKIPLDGIIVDGCSMLDTRALTGESVPKKAEKGDSALSGCINESGALTIEVTKKFGESTASKIIDLVENAAGKKAPTENFITTFSRYYTPIVVVLAALLALTPPLLFSASWVEWLHRGFVFLVISCPCALVISIPLTFFGGIGAASRKGVLVKGSNYLEALDCIETVVFDKTGTLTKGVFNVTEISLVDDLKIKNFNKGTMLEYAAKAECMSNHPIARSIVSAYGKAINESAVKNYSEISGHGVGAEIDGHTVLAGNEKLMITHSVNPTKSSHFGTVVHVAVDGNYIGYIVISDELKADSKETVSKLKDIGINKTVMLTGDGEAIAKSVAESINLDEYYSELLPNQKVEMLEKLGSKKSSNGKLAFVGDGINDAPVLARADVGIAMGAFGSDAAIEAADVVLMTDEPSKLVDAIEVSRRTKRIVTQNIIIVIAIKILFLILGAFGVAGMWEAVFGDVGVMIIAVINAMRILKE
ncbi:MAG: cadmium-translocating P-type ATPase, partial [Lachnospiraceae bacterium]|nr:cadmium-translocating P-type ATPase [Lachnospiraceae bacterium]